MFFWRSAPSAWAGPDELNSRHSGRRRGRLYRRPDLQGAEGRRFLPVTLDNLSTGMRRRSNGGRWSGANLRDRDLVQALVGEVRHPGRPALRRLQPVGESVRDPAKYYDNNVGAADRLRGRPDRRGVRALVFLLHRRRLWRANRLADPEDHPTVPINPYGASKLAFEGAFALAGAGPSVRLDGAALFQRRRGRTLTAKSAKPPSRDAPDPAVVPGEPRQGPAADRVRPGLRHPRRHPDPRLHPRGRFGAGPCVGDPPAAVGRRQRGVQCRHGRGLHSDADPDAAERALGRKVPYSVGPRRAGDPPSLVADSSRLKAEFGWTPTHSDLDTIIRTAARWQEARTY